LNTSLKYNGPSSIIEQLFYAKCRARDVNHKLGLTVAKVLCSKYPWQIMDMSHRYIKIYRIIVEFLDLIARTKDYRFDSSIISDVSDFLIAVISHRTPIDSQKFSLSGRTINSLIALVNEWHKQLQQEANISSNNHKEKPWKGIGVENFYHSKNKFIWTISELKTFQRLMTEGRVMKNCIASYVNSCEIGCCSIFNVSRQYKLDTVPESIATLGVAVKDRQLVQARGKCNSKISDEALNIVTQWARVNNIKINLL
jgi:hypothetical protein